MPSCFTLEIVKKEDHVLRFRFRDDEDFILIFGYLKYDGCCNWETPGTCMNHACGIEYFERLKITFDELYALGREHFNNGLF